MNPGISDIEILSAARQYMGKTAWPTVVAALGIVALYLAVLTATLLDYLPLWLGFALLSYLAYAIYTPLHESVHNNIGGSNASLVWLNKLVGYTVASVLGFTYSAHRAGHMEHHRYTNVPGKDPDLTFDHPSTIVGIVTGGPRLIVSEWHNYLARVYPQAKAADKSVFIVELVVMFGWRGALAAAGYPLEVLLLTVLANLTGLILLGYLFSWVVHRPFNETERYKNTATILMPRWLHKPVTVLWLWQNYHSIHHLFPRVPFYHYASLFDKIREGMEERGAPIVDLQGSLSRAPFYPNARLPR